MGFEALVAAFLPVEALGLYTIATGLAERIWIIPGDRSRPCCCLI